ncbi:MAG: 3-hydroxyacyl-CoA dehydrogenase NAD-binding domain-containing protein [Eubacteriales bacterium]
MGSGISQVFAQAGYQVFMGDVSAVQLEKARRSTEKSLDSLVARGKLGQGEKADIIARITPVQELTVARE